MKLKLFYACNILLLTAICFSSCTKEKLEVKKATDNSTVVATSENSNKQLKVGYTESSPLSSIGNGQWLGYWKQAKIIFQAVAVPSDGSLPSSFTIVSAKGGDVDCGVTGIVTNSWNITVYGVTVIDGQYLDPTTTLYSIMIVQVGNQLQIQKYTGVTPPPPPLVD